MPQLESLRALAVGSVIFSHWIPNRFHLQISWGAIGVQIFFILSGFLLAGILLEKCSSTAPLKEKLHTCRIFYIRRFLRITPLYYTVILITCLVGVSSVCNSWPWHVSYLSNFYFFHIQGWDNETSHFWFIAVLVQFFLFWPALILFPSRASLQRILLSIICFSVLFRFLIQLVEPDLKMLYVLPFMYLDAFAFGSLLGYLTKEKKNLTLFVQLSFWSIPLFMLLQCGAWLNLSSPLTNLILHESGLLGLSWLIYQASRGFKGVPGVILENSTLIYLGKISYGLFIIHNFSGLFLSFINSMLGISLNREGFFIVILRAVFTIGLAMVSYRFLEKPISQFKHRFPYSD